MFIPLSCMPKKMVKFIHKKALDILVNFLLGVYQAVISVRPKYVCSIFSINYCFGDTITRNNSWCGVTVQQTNQRGAYQIFKYQDFSKFKELLSDLSIYLIILHMIGRSKMNERLHGMTPKQVLLDVSEPPKRNKYNKHLIFIHKYVCLFECA